MGDQGAGNGNGVSPGPDFSRIGEDYWVVAEEAVQEVINCVHPTLDSEEMRNDVIEYMQKLVKSSLGFELFPSGSVPLKTYLPDGDIDLTAISHPWLQEFSANGVLSLLQREEQNHYAEYELRDIRFINAEVKVVKCVVRNIVIDISFNQLGGICTLFFLEQVDRFVGKNHLFKRSILLIKTWCYYESRILGSIHGLLSTYALETLVLYIFQLFHSYLESPLQVLYQFLNYFSVFDWDKYCVSVKGPVCKSSLPDIVVEMPEIEVNSLMLSEEFFSNCMEMFTVLTMESESISRVFAPKHVNIIDPLKEYNNLGRSVHRGNFYRIRSAFKYGARKLGRIMSLPIEEIAAEIKKFFSSTLQRHLYKEGCDAEFSSSISLGGYRTLYPSLSSEGLPDGDIHMGSNTGEFANGIKLSSVDQWKERGESHSYMVDTYQSSADYLESYCSSPRDSILEISSLDLGGTDAASLVDTEPLNPLADLAGDYDSHLRCLSYCHGLLLYGPRLYRAPSLPYQYPTPEWWDTLNYPTVPSSCSVMNSNGVFKEPPANFSSNGVFKEPPANFSIQSSASTSNGYFKPRGSDSYLPSMRSSSPKDRPSQWRTKKTAPDSHVQMQKGSSSNHNIPCPAETRSGRSISLKEALSAHIPRQARKGAGIIHQGSNSKEGDTPANDSFSNSCEVEFGSMGPLSDEVISDSSNSDGLTPPVDLQDNGNPASGSNTKKERVADCSFHLKNDEEFPALSRE